MIRVLITLKAGTIRPNTLLAPTLAYWPALSSMSMAGSPTTTSMITYGMRKLAPEMQSSVIMTVIITHQSL